MFSSDLAIDLGRELVRVFAKGRGIVVSEPSMIFVNKITNEIEAFGKEASVTPFLTSRNAISIRAFEDGVIANFEIIANALQYYIRKAHNDRTFVRPRLVISVSSELLEAERYVIEESGYRAGASEVYLVDKVLAAATGSGLPIMEPQGNLVLHVDYGATYSAVLSLGEIVCSHTVKVGIDDIDEAISQHIKSKYNLLVSENFTKTIRDELASAFPLDEPLSVEVRGQHLIEGIPKTVTIDNVEVLEALSMVLWAIVDSVRNVLKRTPPELSSDIIDRGIILTGDGALLKNLDKRLSIELGLPVSIAEDPSISVIIGIGKMLSDFRYLKRIK
ncbi:MAG TPA: rod shape-determining protein MreB [Pyrinomonadaceae bacterium]